MGAFDDFGKKISDFAGNTLQKGKDTAETLKLDMKIGEENDKLKGLFSELGKAYFEAHPDDFDESLGALVAPIKEAQADRKSTRLNSSHTDSSRMPSSA